MERLASPPRPDWQTILEAQGLSFHSRDRYWKEDACYQFSLSEVEEIEAATAEIHALCIDVLTTLVRSERLGELRIPQLYWDGIAESIQRSDFSLYGRLDLVYDGKTPPKLLEYNADTPTSLLESAVCQWFWLQDRHPDADQFNSLHERLIQRWQSLPGTGPVHIACLAEEEEDWVCAAYLTDTATQAGRAVVQLGIEQLGWDPTGHAFVDLEGRSIEWLFKLYPWEWMMREEFGPHLVRTVTRFIEPLWKAPLSCKGLLPILWEQHAGHPNLLPTYLDPGRLPAYAKKPFYSREGANIELHAPDGSVQTVDGPYTEAGFVYQLLQPLPDFEGHHPVIGSWLVDGAPAGMGIRESATLITTNTSHFVPHYFR